jgi:hypothetical protein
MPCSGFRFDHHGRTRCFAALADEQGVSALCPTKGDFARSRVLNRLRLAAFDRCQSDPIAGYHSNSFRTLMNPVSPVVRVD